MKKIQFPITGFQIKIFTMLIILFVVSCSDPIENDKLPRQELSHEFTKWQDVLNELDYNSGIIVQNGNSIQDAILAANSGDAIYIEPGTYKEQITLDKSDIRLIGINGTDNQQVIIESPGFNNSEFQSVAGNHDSPFQHIQLINITVDYESNSADATSRMAKFNRSIKMNRENIPGGYAHYIFDVPVGHGQFDIVRLHRVVHEKRAFHPVRTKGEIFMIHGGFQDFDDIFLTAGSMDRNPETSLPVYLASRGIDVWGIDLGWTLVPLSTDDFTFMKEWGVERDADHTLKAMTLARLIRGLTGQGFGKLNLMGFSYGVPVAYAAAGKETQQHPLFRDIKGIIPVEAGMKYDPADDASRNEMCIQAAGFKAILDGGTYVNNQGIVLAQFGNLALSDPTGDSPFVPGFDNLSAALFIGIVPGANPPAPFWHFVGGTLGPIDFLYTDTDRWLNLLPNLDPYMPFKTQYDFRACQCDEEESSLDDYLGEISIPILYLGAGGGFGMLGEYTSTLTASTDISGHVVSLQPPANRNMDFGHADMFLGEDAAVLVWGVLYKWLINHNGYNL